MEMKRVLLKLSGEALAGPKKTGFEINLRGNQVQKAGKRKYKAYIQRDCQGGYLKEKDVPQKERFHPGL